MRKYANCFFCGGEVKEKSTQREYHWKGELFIFKNVPMGVCQQCGEKFLKAEIGKQMEKMVLMKSKPLTEIKVPVYSL